MIQTVAAPFTAVGEVSGNVAEQISLSAEASPGLAKAIGIAVDAGTGFVPVGGVVRQFAKGVQRGAAAGEAKAAAKTAATAVKGATEKNADTLIQDAIAKGIKTEGVEFPMRWKDIPVDVAEEFAKTGIYPAGLSAADKAKILATRSKAGPVESIIQQPQN